jgi:hypothetical protein
MKLSNGYSQVPAHARNNARKGTLGLIPSLNWLVTGRKIIEKKSFNEKKKTNCLNRIHFNVVVANKTV